MSTAIPNEKAGEQIWQAFHEALKDRVIKVFGILPEGYILFRRAVEAFDAGMLEATALLCRATLESAFQIFLSIRWSNENSFSIVWPTTSNGSRMNEYHNILDAIRKRVAFSQGEMTAINRIREHGNFVAHLASRKRSVRDARVKKFAEWERAHENATDSEKVRIVNKIVQSETSLPTRKEALQDLRDTAVIMLKLGKIKPP